MLRNAARPGVNRNVPTRDASSYEAKGNGLLLAAPKQFASFLVTSSSGAKLRVRFYYSCLLARALNTSASPGIPHTCSTITCSTYELFDLCLQTVCVLLCNVSLLVLQIARAVRFNA